MCTAISLISGNHFFGRTLDYNTSFGEQIVITPRNYSLKFKYANLLDTHYAFIGMATVVNGTPLYYDATNEKGLSVAGLLFSKNAKYFAPRHNYTNIASFEIIPYILSCCKTVDDAIAILKNANITNDNFSEQLKATPLHWIISDSKKSIVLESVDLGLKIYNNPIGVLTNSPLFEIQLWNLNQYLNLSPHSAKNNFSAKITLDPQSKGMGAKGLPGDYSSASRFVKASFIKLNSVSNEEDFSGVNQFFHILNSVSVPKGVVFEKDGYEITRYTSCCDTAKGIYYYTTYNNQTISAVDMTRFNLNSSEPICFELNCDNQIYFHK